MAEVLLIHDSLGQTEGFHALADELREAGHTVHAPSALLTERVLKFLQTRS